MSKCDYCQHVEMCGWRKEIEDQGCEFFGDAERVGHWIVDIDRWGDVVTTVNGYRCDKCSAFNSDKDNYCPNCGAKMGVEE